MIDYLLDNFNWLLIGMSITAVVVFVSLFFVDAGYGKFYTKHWGPTVGNKLGWVLMEAPVFVLMLVFYIMWADKTAVTLLVFLLLFELHYFHRSFIFPFLLRGKSRMPLAIVLMGVLFNSLNAFMQGGWLFKLAPQGLYTAEWLTSPQFIVGTVIFFAGLVVNMHSDYVIRHLRKPGDTNHYLPDKGLYRYVTSANYYGEFFEWCGFAVLTWSWSGAVFALWTFANLGPRAHRIYKRYQQEFPEQMAARPRKRMIPYIWMLLPLLFIPSVAQTQTPSHQATQSPKKYVPYGRFDSWTVRDFKESAIIGGKTKRIYNIGPADTIRENRPYPYNARTPWSSSNAYARVAGVTKTSCTVTPDRSWDGSQCTKLETKYEELKVLGINIRILVSGCIFYGHIFEPIPTANSPYSLMHWGAPFSGRPKALVFDYKSAMPNKGTVTKCKVTSHKTIRGDDAHDVTLVLQKRWEDADGHIHALRVGTAMTRIEKPTSGWVKEFRVPVIYGDARKDPAYKDYMKLGPKGLTYYAKNSKGKIVEIQEEGWARPDETPTHAMLMFTASIHEAFVGTIGNTLWLDNVALEY